MAPGLQTFAPKKNSFSAWNICHCVPFSEVFEWVFLGICLIESSVFTYKLYLFPVCVPWVCFDWMSFAELRSKCSQNTVIVATSSSSLCQSLHYTDRQAAQSCQTLLHSTGLLKHPHSCVCVCVLTVSLHVFLCECAWVYSMYAHFLGMSPQLLVMALRWDFYQVIMPRCVKWCCKVQVHAQKKALHWIF